MIRQLSRLFLLILMIQRTHAEKLAPPFFANPHEHVGNVINRRFIEKWQLGRSERVHKGNELPRTLSHAVRSVREDEYKLKDNKKMREGRIGSDRNVPCVTLNKKTNNPAVRHRKRNSWKGLFRFRRSKKNEASEANSAKGTEVAVVEVYEGRALQERIETESSYRDIIDVPTILKLGPSKDAKHNEPEDMGDIALYKGSSSEDFFSTKSKNLQKSQGHKEPGRNETAANGSTIDGHKSHSQQAQPTLKGGATSQGKPVGPVVNSKVGNNDSSVPSNVMNLPFQRDSEGAPHLSMSGDQNAGTFVDEKHPDSTTSAPGGDNRQRGSSTPSYSPDRGHVSNGGEIKIAEQHQDKPTGKLITMATPAAHNALKNKNSSSFGDDSSNTVDGKEATSSSAENEFEDIFTDKGHELQVHAPDISNANQSPVSAHLKLKLLSNVFKKKMAEGPAIRESVRSTHSVNADESKINTAEPKTRNSHGKSEDEYLINGNDRKDEADETNVVEAHSHMNTHVERKVDTVMETTAREVVDTSRASDSTRSEGRSKNAVKSDKREPLLFVDEDVELEEHDINTNNADRLINQKRYEATSARKRRTSNNLRGRLMGKGI